MYLKRLEIQGFKSFAHKTILDFLPPRDGIFSVTAIVGPNGSGKSNITDAIRWVMGEQSMKNIRAKKGEDVIFNGSETKGALSAAEVTMVLENVNDGVGAIHELPLQEFPEIVITRRLYRSGESEYVVNNNPARLIDIHLLLAKAKFAEHAYSIISQGMIDRLLTVGPAERKDFFDEASGIKEYQIKQHQATLKLDRTEENIRQAESLINEVEPRLKLLARQVKKLEKRVELETELSAAQESYYFTIYSKNKNEIDGIRRELSGVDDSYRNSFAALEKVQVELAGLAKSATRQETFDALQTKHQEAIRAKNELERQLVIIEGQLHTEYNQSGKQNISWLEDKIVELKNKEEKQTSQLDALTKGAEKSRAAASAQSQAVENFSLEQTQLKLKISRLQNQLFKNQSEQNYLQLSGLTAVRAILETGSRFGRVHGLVAQLGEVDEKYRLALEVAAGAHLSSLVVADESVARGAIEHLRANRYGVATFLPLNKIQPRGGYTDAALLKEAGVLGKAIDLIKYDRKFANIFSMIFGDTLVVSDLAVAEKIGIGRARMVTLAGDLIEQRGIMRGGYRGRGNGLGFSAALSLTDGGHLEETQAEINLESNNLVDLERRLEVAKQELMELTVTARSAAEQSNSAADEVRSLAGERSGLERELTLLQASPEEYSVRLKQLATEKETLQKNKISDEKKVEAIGSEIEQFNRREEEKKQRLFTLQDQMQKYQEEVNGFLEARNNLHIQLAKVETKQEDLGAEVASDMKTTLASIVERAPVAVDLDKIVILSDTIQKLKYQLSLIGGIDEEVIKEYGETKERYDFLSGQLVDLKQATEDLRKLVAELDDLMKKRRASAFKKIRKEFSRYFKILFDGGHADLEEVYGEVVEEESETSPLAPLLGGEGNASTLTTLSPGRGTEGEGQSSSRKQKILTGIEVIANPPGKKVKYLSMLSGGERTLTSIALICAILYHNPSPFVVLDEVEAALDEANTLRFAKIIAELSLHSQFIIVTHNRVTMHAANVLYGVVMGPDGISKLLSVKIEDVPKYEDKSAVDNGEKI